MINYSEPIRVKGTEAPARVIGKSEHAFKGKTAVEYMVSGIWVCYFFDENGVSECSAQIENVPPKPETREIEVAGCRLRDGRMIIAHVYPQYRDMLILNLNGQFIERIRDTETRTAVQIAEQNMGAVFGPWTKITLEFPVVK